MKNHAFEAYVREARLQQSIAVGDFIADCALTVWRAVKQASVRIIGPTTTLAARKPQSRPKAA